MIETSLKVLDEEHPDTLVSIVNLAFTWKAQDRDAEAINFMIKYVRLRERVLGVSHPGTLLSSQVLADWRCSLTHAKSPI